MLPVKRLSFSEIRWGEWAEGTEGRLAELEVNHLDELLKALRTCEEALKQYQQREREDAWLETDLNLSIYWFQEAIDNQQLAAKERLAKLAALIAQSQAECDADSLGASRDA